MCHTNNQKIEINKHDYLGIIGRFQIMLGRDILWRKKRMSSELNFHDELVHEIGNEIIGLLKRFLRF